VSWLAGGRVSWWLVELAGRDAVLRRGSGGSIRTRMGEWPEINVYEHG